MRRVYFILLLFLNGLNQEGVRAGSTSTSTTLNGLSTQKNRENLENQAVQRNTQAHSIPTVLTSFKDENLSESQPMANMALRSYEKLVERMVAQKVLNKDDLQFAIENTDFYFKNKHADINGSLQLIHKKALDALEKLFSGNLQSIYFEKYFIEVLQAQLQKITQADKVKITVENDTEEFFLPHVKFDTSALGKMNGYAERKLKNGKVLLFFGGESGTLYGLDTKTYEIVFKYSSNEVILTGITTTQLEDGREVVVFVTQAGKIYIVDLNTGEKIYDFKCILMQNGRHFALTQLENHQNLLSFKSSIKSVNVIDLSTGKKIYTSPYDQIIDTNLREVKLDDGRKYLTFISRDDELNSFFNVIDFNRPNSSFFSFLNILKKRYKVFSRFRIPMTTFDFMSSTFYNTRFIELMDGRIVMIFESGRKFAVLDIRTGEEVFGFQEGMGKAYIEIRKLHDQRTLLAITFHDQNLLLFDLDSGLEFYRSNRNENVTSPVHFTELDDGREVVVFGTNHRKVYVVDLQTKEEVHILPAKGFVSGLLQTIMHSNGRRVIVFSSDQENALYVYDLNTGEEISTLDFKWKRSVQILSDSHVFELKDGRTLALLNLLSDKHLIDLYSHKTVGIFPVGFENYGKSRIVYLKNDKNYYVYVTQNNRLNFFNLALHEIDFTLEIGIESMGISKVVTDEDGEISLLIEGHGGQYFYIQLNQTLEKAQSHQERTRLGVN